MHCPETPCQLQCQIKQLRLTQWTAVTKHGFKVGQQPILSQKKEADVNLRQILLWKQNWAAQPAEQVQGTSKATKSLLEQWNCLTLENGVLYCQWQTEDGCGTRLQLVLPCLLVLDILSALHDAPSAGHLGVTKTVEQMRD